MSKREQLLVTVDPTIRYQTLEGWGTSLSWWGNACGNWADTALKTDLLDKVFGQDGLALNVVRYNIGGGENPEHNHMRPGAQIPGYESSQGQYDWKADAGQREMLQGAIDRGANITEAFINSPPYWMTNSSCSAGSAGGYTNNLQDDATDDFANYITEVLKYFRDNWRINFTTISPFNEPSSFAVWKEGGNQEGCYYTKNKQNEVITAVGRSLEAKGLTSGLSAPEEMYIDWTISTYEAYDETSQNYIKQLNTHVYYGSQREQVRVFALHEKKRLWMSENTFGGSSTHDHNDILLCMQLADGIMLDLKYLKPDAWVFWQIVEKEATEGNYGLIQAGFDEPGYFAITKGYYAFCQFTRFIRPGYVFIGSNVSNTSYYDENVVAAYDAAGRKAVFVVKNNDTVEKEYLIDLTKFASIGIINVYRTSPNENLTQLPDTFAPAGLLVTTVPAFSITTYVVNGASLTNNRIINDSEIGSEINQMNFVGDWDYIYDEGCWDYDRHYSSTADSYVTIPFYGTGFSIIGSKADDLGIFAVSVDNGTETNIDCYDASRVDRVTLFQQTSLQRGEHTIKIRVTGKMNPQSSHATIFADMVSVRD